MLKPVNDWTTGASVMSGLNYVQNRALFSKWKNKAMPLASIALALDQIEAPVKILLGKLVKIGWVKKTNNDYLWIASFDDQLVPDLLPPFVKGNFPGPSATAEQLRAFSTLFNLFDKRWLTKDVQLISFLDGTFLLPLFFGLYENATPDAAFPEERLHKKIRSLVVGVFKEKKWVVEKGSSIQLTARFRKIIDACIALKKNTPAASALNSAGKIHSPKKESQSKKPATGTVDGGIAVIGMSGRFPGSDTLDMFWENLKENKDLIIEIPADRWIWQDHASDPAKTKGDTRVKWGGFINDIDKFEPFFFNISPREAELMDPQQRIAIEAVYHALEDAAIPLEKIKGTDTGIFIGASSLDYYGLLQKEGLANQLLGVSGSSQAILANRISYLLDIHGPSEPVNTACSSSLIAIHRAVENIKKGNCVMAIAGGVNAMIAPQLTLAFNQAGLLSADGRCKTFDQGANGYVRSEGVGMVVLKSLSEAEKDGDRIYGVIRATAENHGGKTNTLTTPNPNAQRDLLVDVYRNAGVDPRDVSYIETHGTGTLLGDPVEIKGLTRAFKILHEDHGIAEPAEPYCALGSVKANIGHLETAAGAASVIKVLLAFKNKTLPGNPHLNTKNKFLKLEQTPFYLLRETRKWQIKNNTRRIAGVSGFGFGGANCHLVLEEYGTPAAKKYSSSSPAIIVLSAKDQTRLRASAVNLKQWLEQNKTSLFDQAYTLQVGRTAMEHRLAIIADTSDEAVGHLGSFINDRIPINQRRIFCGAVVKDAQAFDISTKSGSIFFATAVQEKEFDVIAKLWVNGAAIDWQLLYHGNKPQKTPMPLYPFARERYWFDRQLVHQTPPAVVAGSDAIVNAPEPREPPVKPDASEIEQVAKQQLQEPVTAAEVLEKLSKILSGILYVDSPLAPDLKFTDCGLDSITGVEYAKSINKEFRINMSATDLYDHPTLRRLSLYVKRMIELRSELMPTVIDAIPDAPVEENKTKVAQAVEVSNGLVIKEMQDIRAAKTGAFKLDTLKNGEVKIKVMASAVNFADILCIKGLYPTMPAYPFVPGFEVAGIIVEMAGDVTSFSIGQKVVALTGRQMGGHGSHVNVASDFVVRMPGNLSFEEACSLPVVFLTAYYALWQGGLAKQQPVLIQTAAGGCGLMSIQLCNLMKAISFGTSSKKEKLSFLSEIGVAHTADYTSPLFAEEIQALNKGNGFSIVLNTLSGKLMQTGLNLLAPGGRYIELAVHALKTSFNLDLSQLTDNQQIKSIDLRKLILSEQVPPGSFKTALELMVDLVEKELIRPVVSKIYPVEEMSNAMEFVETGNHIGKVVISHTSNSISDNVSELVRTLKDQKEKAAHLAAFALHPVLSVQRVEINPPRQELADIAIIGVSGKFPGAENLDVFWKNLENGRDAVVEIPEDRWQKSTYFKHDQTAPGKSYSKWMGVLADIDKFDPLFFNISPFEARLMDPQQRVLLEESWKAIESAGYDPSKLSNIKCGVFIGAAQSDYYQIKDRESEGLDSFALTGNSNAILSGRLSYFLNLKGPCFSVDTACSSSLVAIAQACDSLLLNNCEMALAGGVCILSTPALHIMTSKAGMLSPDGKCNVFDNNANGFVPGEACGVLLLKRLDRAEADGDIIYGTIKGWGTNQDGSTNGITAPSKDSQVSLLQDVYKKFGVDPASISFVEAHGTGTKLGDPIEIKALVEAFSRSTNMENYCGIGSVKSNIGHTLAAAGMASVIKVLLSFKNKKLPATIHFNKLNEHIDLAHSPFYINDEHTSLNSNSGTPLRAAVNSFGFSGTNAHLIMEAYNAAADKRVEENIQVIIPVSAKNATRLTEQVSNLACFLRASKATSLIDIAYTLQTGRHAMEHRLAIVASSIDELLQKMDAYLNGQNSHVIANVLNRKNDNLGKLIRYGQFDNLFHVAFSWAQGTEIDWESFYKEGSRPARIALPVYPFERKVCWKIEDKSLDKTENAIVHGRSSASSVLRKHFLSNATPEKSNLQTLPEPEIIEDKSKITLFPVLQYDPIVKPVSASAETVDLLSVAENQHQPITDNRRIKANSSAELLRKKISRLNLQ